jgi:hypothetical protein
MEQTDVDNYVLSCLSPTNCPPKDFQGLIQLIIDKLCALTDCCEGGGNNPTTRVGCPDDCQLVVAPCFRYENQFGDLVTSMTLTDYAIAIGNKVCALVSDINTINATLVSLDIRITALEDAPPPTFTLPLVTPVCVLPSNPTDMNIVLSALEAQFCTLIGATGGGNDIYNALTRECLGLTASPQLGGVGNMGTLPNWVSNVQNLAQSINNIWLTICDLRSAVATIQATCCPSGCDGITLLMTASLEGSILTVYLTGTIPVGFATCFPGITQFTISDGINSTIFPINVVSVLNVPGGVPLDLSVTPINLAANLTVSGSPCLENITTGSNCQYSLVYVAAYPGTCPLLAYVQTDTTIQYSGIVTSTGTFVVEVWNNAGTTMISSQTSNLSSGNPLNGTFVGLVASTTYKIRVKVIPGGDGVPLYCPFTTIQTSVSQCPEPTNLVAILNT